MVPSSSVGLFLIVGPLWFLSSLHSYVKFLTHLFWPQVSQKTHYLPKCTYSCSKVGTINNSVPDKIVYWIVSGFETFEY